MVYMNKLLHLELILDRQNTKQGAGFVVFGRVVDLKTLGNIIGGLVSFASVVVPVLYSLRPSKEEAGGDTQTCELSTAQKTAVQEMLGAINVSCTYNMTVGPSGVTMW